MRSKSAIRKLVAKGYEVSTEQVRITPNGDGSYVVNNGHGNLKFTSPRKAVKLFLNKKRKDESAAADKSKKKGGGKK